MGRLPGKIALTRRVETDVCSVAVWTAVAFCSRGRLLVCMLLSVLVHELGHLLCLYKWKIPWKKCTVSVFGADLVTQGLLSYRREGIMLFCGSAVNLLCALALLPVYCLTGRGGMLLCTMLLYAGFNLLPLHTLDGGRLLYILLARNAEEATAWRVTRFFSVGVTCILWCIGAAMFFRSSMLSSGFSTASSLFFLSLFFIAALSKNENKGV